MGVKPQDIRANFNDRSDPSFAFENQCVAYRRTCPSCGTRFPLGATKCIECGEVRPRCQHRAMENNIVCRSHATGRPYSIYSKLAGTLSDTVLEEIIEADDRDTSQEFALARIALSTVLDHPGEVKSDKLLQMIKDFFTIAEKKKNLEQGQVLNISWNDDLANSLRIRIRKLLKTFEQILEEYIPDQELRYKILVELKERTKLQGNLITSPPQEGDYVKPEEGNNQ